MQTKIVFIFWIVELVEVFIKEGGRQRRSANEPVHSETYDLDFSLSGSAVHLHLTKNNHINAFAPLLSLQGGVLKSLDVDDDTVSIYIHVDCILHYGWGGQWFTEKIKVVLCIAITYSLTCLVEMFLRFFIQYIGKKQEILNMITN